MKQNANLLYIEEHLGCKNYIKENNVGFSSQTFTKNNAVDLNLKKEFVVVFVLTGRLSISDNNKQTIILTKREIGLLTNYSTYQILPKTDCTVVFLYFERPNSRCEMLAFESMADKVSKKDNKKIRKLPMKKPVTDFLKSVLFYLNEKMNCRHLHDIKETELLFLIRGFYPKEDVIQFFTPVIHSLNSFNNVVRANYLKVKTVNELASICNMSTKTLTRRFLSEFGETPKQWIMREKSKYDNKPKKHALNV
ncbi:MAG: AraC family transcriptional regulator [Paludibacteraceae bacterium]